MKVREVLGVDFCRGRLHVVQVGLGESGRPVLTRWASRAVPPDADSSILANVLRSMLEEGGFTTRSAVFGLPKGRGFIRCQGGSRPAEPTPAAIDYVTDSWTTAEGRRMLGVASRADVARLMEIADQASLELLALDLRSMGELTALGLLDESAGGSATAGLIIGQTDLTFALAAGQAALAVQSRPREPAGADALARFDSALASAKQMLHLAAMAHPDSPPAAARVIVNAAGRQAAKALGGRLGVPVESVGPGEGVGLEVAGELDAAADYAAAIGLALEGLSEAAGSARARRAPAVGRFNFLRAAKPPRRRRVPSWRDAAVAGAVVILVAVAVVVGYGLKKQAELNELEAEYARLLPDLEQQRRDQQLWRTVGPWLSPAEGGRRLTHRPIYDAMAELFPSGQAYVHTAVIERDGAGQAVGVELKGRAREAKPLHEFVTRLNASPMFERASLGPVVDDAKQAEFPKSFSVTFAVRKPE